MKTQGLDPDGNSGHESRRRSRSSPFIVLLFSAGLSKWRQSPTYITIIIQMGLLLENTSWTG